MLRFDLSHGDGIGETIDENAASREIHIADNASFQGIGFITPSLGWAGDAALI